MTPCFCLLIFFFTPFLSDAFCTSLSFRIKQKPHDQQLYYPPFFPTYASWLCADSLLVLKMLKIFLYPNALKKWITVSTAERKFSSPLNNEEKDVSALDKLPVACVKHLDEFYITGNEQHSGAFRLFKMKKTLKFSSDLDASLQSLISLSLSITLSYPLF